MTGKSSRRWIVAAAVGALLLGGCGSSIESTSMVTEEVYDDNMAAGGTMDGGAYSKSASYDTAEAMPAEEVLEEEVGSALPESVDGSQPVQGEIEKKLIRDVYMEVETKEFDALLTGLTQRAEALGGYVESVSTSRVSLRDPRYGNLTLRIPSEKLDEFLDQIKEQSNVLSQNESVQDVTLQYVDLESHKKVLLTEQKRLLELLEQAETVTDMIEIESRLSDVRYQLESMEAKLRTIDRQVSYSKVYLGISEVEILTPQVNKSVWTEISEGFMGNVYWVCAAIKRLAIKFVIGLPVLLAWAVVIIVLCLFGKLLRRRRAKYREHLKKKKESMSGYETACGKPEEENTEKEKPKDGGSAIQ